MVNFLHPKTNCLAKHYHLQPDQMDKTKQQMIVIITTSVKIEFPSTFIITSYAMVVIWTWRICLICMPEAQGPQARGITSYISGKS